MESIEDALNEHMNRKLIISFLSSQCQNKYSATMCLETAEIYVNLIFDNLFNISFEKDFVCSYIFPICNEEQTKSSTYKKLDANEYIKNKLAEKPLIVENDDFLNKLYEKVSHEQNELG